MGVWWWNPPGCEQLCAWWPVWFQGSPGYPTAWSLAVSTDGQLLSHGPSWSACHCLHTCLASTAVSRFSSIPNCLVSSCFDWWPAVVLGSFMECGAIACSNLLGDNHISTLSGKWVALFSRKVPCYRSGAVPLFSTSDNLMMFCSSLTWWPHQESPKSSAQWTGLHMCTSKPGVGTGKIFNIVNIYPETCLWTAGQLGQSFDPPTTLICSSVPGWWARKSVRSSMRLSSLSPGTCLSWPQQVALGYCLHTAWRMSMFGFSHLHGVVDSECWVNSIRDMIQCFQDWFLSTWTTC